jgi:hypothetical protein
VSAVESTARPADPEELVLSCSGRSVTCVPLPASARLASSSLGGVQGAGDRRAPARALGSAASGEATAAHDGRSRVARCSESAAAAAESGGLSWLRQRHCCAGAGGSSLAAGHTAVSAGGLWSAKISVLPAKSPISRARPEFWHHSGKGGGSLPNGTRDGSTLASMTSNRSCLERSSEWRILG